MAAGLVPSLCRAQAVAIGAGYTAPQPVDVAPGQLITLFVRVPGKTAGAPVTAQPPLPASLAGFSVTLRQSFPSDPLPVPIQAVSDSSSCAAPTPVACDVVSLVTVQVPYELTPNVPGTRMPSNFARLDINYDGSTTTSLALNPVTDRIHVLNSCDVVANVSAATCQAMIAHGDGKLVDLMHPAQPGEILTLTAVGLGPADQQLKTGSADGQATVSDLRIAFDQRTNEAPDMPGAAVSSAPATSVRLRSGAVGIYEITFTVPPLAAGALPCSTLVRSNLTVSVGRVMSYDGAGICVDTGQ